MQYLCVSTHWFVKRRRAVLPDGLHVGGNLHKIMTDLEWWCAKFQRDLSARRRDHRRDPNAIASWSNVHTRMVKIRPRSQLFDDTPIAKEKVNR
ncbi:MAG: hypothetical protein B5766_08740 [Candidatus Lumbricidophila eiseniae]|uniref:Uncharacterized protein n=1 Tax=Candidatus Lumbricidiphila eiseniae TaxID=1969409 RepID=A0A2A6FPN6_9MICO|nr:MAG: hypothetical protein B5766_08740 [Candidatus Lumbricidophila eiseniae]